MAKTYRVTPQVRFVNSLVRLLIRLRLAPKDNYLLSVRGWKTGKIYTIPVILVEEGGRRWLVSPYGYVNWVRNARAAGQVELSQKGRTETVSIFELGPEESAPVLKRYLENTPIVQPYFDARPDSPLADFMAEAPRHPVFRIEEKKFK